MTLNEFVAVVKVAFKSELYNPGGGTSTIAGFRETKVSCVRGRSTIGVAFSDLYEACSNFKGHHVSSIESTAEAIRR